MARRQSSPAGFVFAWLLVAGLCIAFWPWALAIGLPIVGGLIALGAIAQKGGNQTAKPRKLTAVAEAVVYRGRCDYCGAPRRNDAEACRYCGRSLVVARRVTT